MTSFHVDQQGVHDSDSKRMVVAQPVEVVRYSERDDTIYLQWPAENATYQHMAAIPRRIIDASTSLDQLIGRCAAIGLEVSKGMEQALRSYLQQATERVLHQV